MIDTHCHLNFKAFNKDLELVVRRFQKEGGEGMIVVGANIDSSKEAIKISHRFPTCFASVGIHPHHLNSITSFEKTRSELTKLASHKKVVAIGETGIDFYLYKDKKPLTQKGKDQQQQLFRLHLTLAHKLRLPLIIHCRQAQKDLLNILAVFLKTHSLTGVFHCFDGSKKYLETVLALGFFIGFDGNLTYEKNKHLQKLVKLTPLERLLIETDSPYLAPVPYRGQRNEPFHLASIAEFIAEIKKKDKSFIMQKTSENAKELFRLP